MIRGPTEVAVITPNVAADPTLVAGPVTSYTYDWGNRVQTVAQGGQSRQFIYDSLGRLTGAQNPESGLTT